MSTVTICCVLTKRDDFIHPSMKEGYNRRGVIVESNHLSHSTQIESSTLAAPTWDPLQWKLFTLSLPPKLFLGEIWEQFEICIHATLNWRHWAPRPKDIVLVQGEVLPVTEDFQSGGFQEEELTILASRKDWSRPAHSNNLWGRHIDVPGSPGLERQRVPILGLTPWP